MGASKEWEQGSSGSEHEFEGFIKNAWRIVDLVSKTVHIGALPNYRYTHHIYDPSDEVA